MSTALYPGSFDPITEGHLDIIRRAAAQFDHVVVCVMINADKHGLFQPEERAALIRRVTSDLPNVTVDSSCELLADYAREKGITCVVKGLRAMSDFEKEFQMALINHRLNGELETFFIPSRQEYTYLSSSIVKEMASYQVNLEGFVPKTIISDVMERINAVHGKQK